MSTVPAATSVATIQAAAAAAPAVVSTAFATGKFSCDWSQTIMIAGVACAIIGLVAAIFTNSALAIIGFALLGISSGLGLFIAQNSVAAEEIQSSIVQLQQQNVTLETQRKRIEAVVKTITAENNPLKDLRAQLQRSITSLRAENQRLTTLNTALTRNIASLDIANRTLQTTKIQLEGKIAQLEQDLERLKAEVESFVTQNVDFAAKVGALNGAVGTLTTAEGNLRTDIAGFDRTLGASLSQLTAQVALAKTVSGEVFSHMDAEQQQLKQQAATLRREVSEVRALSDCLEARVAKLTSGQAQIEEREKALAITETQFLETAREERAEIEKLRQSLQEQNSQLTAERARWNASLAEAEGKLLSINLQSTAVAAELTKQAALKQAELARIREQIASSAATLVGLQKEVTAATTHTATTSGFDTPS